MDADIAFSKQKRLETLLRTLDSLLVAFSGGVDSSFLLGAAHKVLGTRVRAATALSPIHPRGEQEKAARFCADRGIVQVRFDSGEMGLEEFLANPPERCYICKKNMIRRLFGIAGELGAAHVAHGANLDDQGDYRPGARAALEAGLLAPLVEAGLTKAEIRFLARDMGLSAWNSPAMACLATRIPYGDVITQQKLRAVEEAEEALLAEGFSQVRVRHHGAVARVEVAPHELEKITLERVRGAVVKKLRQIGFHHVALDLEGYVSGKMNRELGNPTARRRNEEEPS